MSPPKKETARGESIFGSYGYCLEFLCTCTCIDSYIGCQEPVYCKQAPQRGEHPGGYKQRLKSTFGRSTHGKKSGQVGKYPESTGFLLAILKRQCGGEDIPRPVEPFENAVLNVVLEKHPALKVITFTCKLTKNNEEFGEAAKVGDNVLPGQRRWWFCKICNREKVVLH